VNVASYCRVSTDKADQANSFEAQCRYFDALIRQHPGWELYRVYADEGVTGTSTKRRNEFNRMMEDALRGRFQLIVTKEVSRFSRNILDTITYTRQLKELGIGVLFVNDGISTLEPDAELRLSIMGSIAQEESRKTSSRVTWGQTRQMERGVVFGRSLLGYDVEHGVLTVNPDGAKLVRMIFYKYGVEKKGTRVIARELEQEGYRTITGNPKWNSSHIIKILRNEKYVGDLIQRKTYTPDYLTHRKKINRGEAERIAIAHHHAAIIDRELWDIVQDELTRRNKRRNKTIRRSGCYVFSGTIMCGECGRVFTVRKRKRKDGAVIRRWCCSRVSAEGRRKQAADGTWRGCDVGRSLREDHAADMVRQALCALQFDREEVLSHVTELAMAEIEEDVRNQEVRKNRMERELAEARRKRLDVIDASFSGELSKMDMKLLVERYDTQIARLRSMMDEVSETEEVNDSLATDLAQEVCRLLNQEYVSDMFLKNVLQRITVYKNGRSALNLKELDATFWFDG